MRPVETAEAVGVGRGTFDGLAERSGFTPAECALAAATGRLGAIIGVMRARDAGRRRLLAGLPPVPTPTAEQVKVRMRYLALRGR